MENSLCAFPLKPNIFDNHNNNFLGCKCGVERTRRIVGGSEVEPVKSVLSYIVSC